MIDENFAVWVGNLTDATLNLEPGELFGFGRGTWEAKQVRSHLRQPTLLSQCAISALYTVGSFIFMCMHTTSCLNAINCGVLTVS